MNKIPQNYLSKLSQKETQQALKFIKEFFVSELNETMDTLEVRSPLFTNENQLTEFEALQNSRAISFDSANDDDVYYLYNDLKFWLINTVEELEIKNNHSIFTFNRSVLRDVRVTNVSSLEKNELIIEYRLDNNEVTFKKMVELSEMIYKMFVKLNKKLKKQFSQLSITLPPTLKSVDFEKIRKQKVGADIDGLRSEVANLKGIFLMTNKSSDDNTSNHLSIDAYNDHIDSSYSIANIINRVTSDDLSAHAEDTEKKMEDFLFIKERLNNQTLRTINITIDLDLLAVFLLEKSHVLELQSGKFNDEIEKIFNIKKIKHL